MELKLKAQIRDLKEKTNMDFIAAVLYGKGIENKNLKLKRSEFEKLFKVAGESNLIDLDFGEGPVKVLVKDIQRDIIKDFISHVDFYQVNMKEKTTAEIPLHFIGESKAVKELGGMLMKEIDTLEVECLPGDLVDHIDVDISVLETFEDAIRVADIKLPKGLEVLADETNTIVTVQPPKLENEVEANNEEATEEEKEEEKKEEGGEEKKEEENK